MKKSKKKIIILVIMVFLLTGCTTQLKDVDGQVVQNKETDRAHESLLYT